MSMTNSDLTKVLKQVRQADRNQVDAQFQIANILTAIKDHKLYELGGYDNFQMMVRGELDFAPSCAIKYVSLHNSFTKFKYTKTEYLKLMQQFGWRRVEEALSKSTKKMGHRAIKSFMDAKHLGSSQQFNFNVTDKKVAAKLESRLAKFGLEVMQSGQRSHLTTSFLALLEDYDRLVESTEHTTGKRKLKAVS